MKNPIVHPLDRVLTIAILSLTLGVLWIGSSRTETGNVILVGSLVMSGLVNLTWFVYLEKVRGIQQAMACAIILLIYFFIFFPLALSHELAAELITKILIVASSVINIHCLVYELNERRLRAGK